MIEKERPDALLATLGGQTALNTAMALDAAGVLEKYGVELIGASIEAIHRGENRESFKKIVEELGGEVARSRDLPHDGRLPRPRPTSSATRWWSGRRFTMGGTGSGMAYDETDLRRIAGAGLAASPTTEVLLEESIIGWKEYELEVMRDKRRQRGDRLLDREPRPDGRAHRRLDHGRAGDDADRPRVPAPARPRPSASSARSGSTPAAATSSSRSTPTTAGWS